MNISSFLLPLIFLFSFSPASAQITNLNYLELAGLSPYAHYQTFETEHFKMIYQEGYLDFTEKAAGHLEHIHRLLSPILKWQPRGKTTILVADNNDSANGFTMPALRVGIVLIATPPDAWTSLSYTDDWIKLLVFHEYTHMLNIDATTEWMEALRVVFGDVIRPNGLWPVWMLEGLAVYFETRTSYFGRGRSPYYDAILSAYLNEGRLGTDKNFGMTLDRVNGSFPYFPGGDIAYLFGYHLWNQFAQTQSEEKMGEYSLRSSHRVPYFIEGNLENITNGKNWKDYWNSFVTETKSRLGSQIQKIKADGVTPREQLTHAGYSALGGAISPDGNWMAFTQVTQQERQGLFLRNLKTGNERRIDDKMLGVGMGFTPDSRFLIYSSLNTQNTYYTYSDLFSYDLKKDKIKQLTHGLRAKEPAVSPDGKTVTFIQVQKASHTLKSATLDINNDEVVISKIKNLYSRTQFAILGNPSFLDNKTVLYSLQEPGKGYSDLFSVGTDGNTTQLLYHDGKMNRYPIASQGKIYFVSDLTRVENIFELTDAHQARRMTNIITGVAAPFAAPNGDLYSSLMTSNGYEIVRFRKEDLHPFMNNQHLSEPSAPTTMKEAVIAPAPLPSPHLENYSPLGSLAPREWTPLAYLTDGSYSGWTAGGLALGFDSTGKHQYTLLADYNFKPKTLDGAFSYSYYGFRPEITLAASAQTTSIGADALHTEYQRHFETAVALDFPIFWTYSSLRPRVYGFINWNRLYDMTTQLRVPTGDFEYDQQFVPGLGVSLTFSDAEGSALGFMSERGNDFAIQGENRMNLGEYSVFKYLASYTHYFKIAEHSVMEPRARILGTTHVSNTILGDSFIQGKRTYDITDEGTRISLTGLGVRGYSDVALGFASAHTIGDVSLDYHFPIRQIFSGLHDTLPAFFNQIHGFVFGETAYVPVTRAAGSLYLPSYGGGLSLDTTLLIRAPIRFTLEAQNGTNKSLGGDTLLFFSMQSASLF